MALGGVSAAPTLSSTPAANNGQNPQNLYQALPGLQGMLGSAQSNISNLLSGYASPSLARTDTAYFGAGTGQIGTGANGGVGTFIGNRGADLYGQQAQQSQQTGLSNLMGLLQGTSGTLAPTPGQNQQNSQFYSQLGQSGGEFQQSLAEQQFVDQVNALIGLSNSGIGGVPGSPGSNGQTPFSLPSLNYQSPY